MLHHKSLELVLFFSQQLQILFFSPLRVLHFDLYQQTTAIICHTHAKFPFHRRPRPQTEDQKNLVFNIPSLTILKKKKKTKFLLSFRQGEECFLVVKGPLTTLDATIATIYTVFGQS